MLKHRVTVSRRRHHSQGSENSFDELLQRDVKQRSQPAPSPASVSCVSNVQVSNTFAGCCGGNRWPSTIFSSSKQQQSYDDDTGSASTSISVSTTATKLKQTFRLPRRQPSFSLSANNPGELMRRRNSFHSTRSECHPNRFRRNRKSTSPNNNPGTLQKISVVMNSPGQYGRHSVEEDHIPARNWALRRDKSVRDDVSSKIFPTTSNW